MSLKAKITSIIEDRIKEFGNSYQNAILKNSSQANSGVQTGTIEKVDGKTGKADFRTSDGKLITGIQPSGSSIGPGSPGVLLGGAKLLP